MSNSSFHILLVDDDNRIRELVREYLAENNFLVTTAKDAIDAKKKLEIIKFDILILDIMMPGESGLSLTKEVKKNNPTPIILLTAKGETKDRIEGLELGADDYLGKPFEPKELLLRIKNILNKVKKPIPKDEIYFVADSTHVSRAMQIFGHEEVPAQSIIIIGAGNIGLQLSKNLQQEAQGVNVKLIESNKERAEQVAEALDDTIVIHGDALEREILEEVNVAGAETIIAVSDDDEVNILSSVLAKRYGCSRAVALINETTYAPLISPLGIDTAISPRDITVSRILEHIRRGRIHSVHSLRSGNAEVIEADALESAPVIGVPLQEAKLPRGVLVGALLRDNQVIIPRGQTMIQTGDRVIIFSPKESIKAVEKLFSVAFGYF